MSMYHPHDPVRLDASKGGRTKQSFADESNINLIMKKYVKTGMLDHLNKHEGQYSNFVDAPDYHTAMNSIREAGEMFMEIPATIRAEFENDPAQFLAFVQNPENQEKMVKMGLARPNPLEEPKAVTKPAPAPPSPEAPTPPGDAPIPPTDTPLPL